jgi:hypothetical protein
MNETYSGVRAGKFLSDTIPIKNGLKQGDALSQLLFNFALEYVIKSFQINEDGLQFNDTHHLLVYADHVIALVRSVHKIRKNTEALVVVSKESGLEVTDDKTKYMVMSRDQHAGRSHSIKIDNSSFQRVKQLKYLGTILTN